jgi:hypothetical protein
MKSRLLASAILPAFAAGIFACDDATGNDDQEWEAALSAAAEIPAPTGSPTASGTAALELNGRTLSVLVSVTGNLTSDVAMAHIHGPATTTATAGIVLDFVPAMQAIIAAGTRTGTMVSASYDLDALPVSATGVLRVHPDTLIAFMNTGRAYVNVHTQTNASGELRGQITQD